MREGLWLAMTGSGSHLEQEGLRLGTDPKRLKGLLAVTTLSKSRRRALSLFE